MAQQQTIKSSYAQRALLGPRLFTAPAFARCVWQQAALQAWEHGFRVAPGLLALAVIAGAGLGGGLFPAMRDFGMLANGVVLGFNWIHFELAPIMAALWYAVFSSPRHLLTAIGLNNGEGAVLTLSGLHSQYFIDIPGFWGAFIAMFTQTVWISLAMFGGALVFWSVATGIPATPLIEWWSVSLDPLLLVALPFKIASFAYVLTQVPLKVGQRFASMDQLTRAGGFFRITWMTLVFISLLQALWIVLIRII